jgi:hypothetical protein
MDMLVRGRHVITDPAVGDPGVLEDGAVLVSGSRITEVGAWAALRRRHPRARVVGNGRQLVMPGLVDAHSHGRALSPIQKGVLNDYLENNLLDWAFMPVFDPELMASLAAWRHLRSGCTTMHHMGFDTEGPQAPGRCEKAIRTYLRCGLRIAFAPGVRNVDKLVLDSAAFLETLPPDLQAFAAPLVNVDAKRMEEEYFALFEHLHGRFASEDTRVLLSPSWAQAVTESFLLRAKATADRLGKVPTTCTAYRRRSSAPFLSGSTARAPSPGSTSWASWTRTSRWATPSGSARTTSIGSRPAGRRSRAIRAATSACATAWRRSTRCTGGASTWRWGSTTRRSTTTRTR